MAGTGNFTAFDTSTFVLSHSSFIGAPTQTLFTSATNSFVPSASTADHCHLTNFIPQTLTVTNPIARPQFVNENDTTPVGFVQIGCSPGLNVATQGKYDSLASATTDLLGNPRTAHGTVDIGAIETQGVLGPDNIVAGPVVGDTSICLLQNHIFKPQATSLYGGLKYQWLEDGGLITISDSLNINGQPFYNNGTTFSYVAFNACGSDTSPEFRVFVKDPGIPNLSVPGQTVCEGETLTLAVAYAAPGNDPAGSQTTWHLLTGAAPHPQVGTGDTMVISAVSSANVGSYYYLFDHVCYDGPAKLGGYGYVKVNPKYSGAPITLSVEGGNLVAPLDFGFFPYIWFLDGVPFDTTALRSITPTQPGVYVVGIFFYDSGFCDTLLLSNPITFPFVSVDNKQLNTLTISPNPAKETVRIGGLTGPAHCRISNMLGQEVWHTQLEADGLLTIPASVAPGLYTVQVEGYANLRITLN